MNAFLTGSHAYGTPTAESDIDLVVLIDDASFDVLSRLSDCEEDESDKRKYAADMVSGSFRFGQLNLIAVSDKNLFDIWKKGTDQLIAERPVTRDHAVAVLSAMREAFFKTLDSN